jgi:inositol transport system substrate-binding protein
MPAAKPVGPAASPGRGARTRRALGRAALGAVLTAGVASAILAAEPEKTLLISFSKASEPFFVLMRGHAESVAKQLGVSLVFADGKGDSPSQAAEIENAVGRKRVEGVIVAPNDIYALVPAVNYVLSQEVPVITVDRHVIGTSREVPHVGIDNVAAGKMLAKWVIGAFPDGARILHLTGQPGSSTGLERAKGVREGLAEAGSKYQIVADVSGDWSRTEGYMVTLGQLTFLKSPPNAIIADNDDMALGALSAIKEAGLAQAGTRVIGFDAIPAALEQVREGALAATVDQKPGAQIQAALTMMADHLRKGTPLRSVTIQPILVTKDNLNTAENASQMSQ